MAKKQEKKPAATKAAGSKKKNHKPNTLTVRFVNIPASKYRIAGKLGQEKTLPKNQAMEMIDNGDAELVE